ncbi:MAG: DMT family transporter [Mycobacteriaceae bacterium]|nr:DMT family transporter [Mycobacteriaceae bacterium]
MRALVVLLALLASVFMALGIVIRQRATMEVPPEHGVSTTMFTTLLRNPLWWAGTGVAVAGYVCQALALTHGSLIIVQPLLVSSLLFALPISARLAHRRVTPSEWAWALLLTVGLAVFVLLARPHAGDYRAAAPAWALVSVIVVPVVVVCVVIGARSTGRLRAGLLAAAVGVLFGVVAVLTKITMQRLAAEGVWSVLAVPAPYLLVVVGVATTLLQQSALHAGVLKMSVPTMLVLEPMVAVLLGVVVLGEDLTVTGFASAALPIALAAMAAATVALGRDEGALEEQLQATVAGRSESPSRHH